MPIFIRKFSNSEVPDSAGSDANLAKIRKTDIVRNCGIKNNIILEKKSEKIIKIIKIINKKSDNKGLSQFKK